MAGSLASGILVAAALATVPGVADVAAPQDRTDPYAYWLLAESNDGMESVYLRDVSLGKNADTGNFHAFFVITDDGPRVESFHYARQFEIEFNCDNRTYAPRASWYYGADGQQTNVAISDQVDLMFSPIKPDGPFYIASQHLCDAASLEGFTRSGQVKVSQLNLYQDAKYLAAAQMPAGVTERAP